MKETVKNIFKNIRAGIRTLAFVAVAPLVILAATVQGAIVGRLTGNDNVIPKMIYNSLRHVIGYRIVFNKTSAPLVKDKSTWFIANHMSLGDFAVLGSALRGTFAGKGDINRWPLVGSLARAVNFIGLRRSSEYNAQSRAKIIENFNHGHNTIMFPEGTTTDGAKVSLFRAALLTLLYGEKGTNKEGVDVSLERDVVVQPIAIRVLKVDGKSTECRDDLRDIYSQFNEASIPKTFWKHMKEGPITIELTAFPPMKPSDYADAKELANAAAAQIVTVVNPGQTTFEKAQIPVNTATVKPKAAV